MNLPSDSTIRLFKELQKAKFDHGVRYLSQRAAMTNVRDCVEKLHCALMDADRQGVRLTVSVEEYERNSFNIEVTGKARTEVDL